jgi:flagellar basal body-associated protein FliL
MSEKAEKKAEAGPADKKDGGAKGAAPAAAGGKGGGGGLMTKTPVLIGAVMFLEAIVLFAGFKFVGGGPKGANGADLTTGAAGKDEAGGKKADGTPDEKDKIVEIPVLDFKAPNKMSGRTMLYDVSIVVTVKATAQDTVQQRFKDREALIKDRIRTIIAATDPEKLGGGSEPGLETLRRQVKYQLDEIVGDGVIDEVLVPRCIPYRTDY